MTPTELASLEALAKAATPGKWYEGNKWVFVDEPANPFSNALQNVLRDVPEAQANAAYIAAANPATIRTLLAERDSLAGEEERLRAALANSKITGCTQSGASDVRPQQG